MGAITGQITTFNRKNYEGELILVNKTANSLLTRMGIWNTDRYPETNGWKLVNSKKHSWQTKDIKPASQTGALEGASPSVSGRSRTLVENTLQIFQEGIDVSYSALGAFNQLNNEGTGQGQPVRNEITEQIELKLLQIKNDYEYSAINGVYAYPVDNSSPRKMRGLVSAITTNVINANGKQLNRDLLNSLLKAMFANGGLQGGNNIILVNAYQKIRLSSILAFPPQSKVEGGFNITYIETDFGPLEIILNANVPTDKLLVVSANELVPVAMPIPDPDEGGYKGILFLDKLAQVGSSYAYQIYGELGFEYGAEQHHGMITELATS